MNELPHEIIENIADYLSIPDVLSFRLVGRKYAQRCIRKLQQERTRVYLHPTRLSQVMEVCNHTELRKNISEILIVGKSTPRMGTVPSSPSIPIPTGYDHSWPYTAHGASHTPRQEISETADVETMPFPQAYGPIARCSSKAEQSRRSHVQWCSAEPGFCLVSSANVNNHAAQYPGWNTSLGSSDQDPDSFAKKTIRWSDCEFLIGLLCSGSVRGRVLSLEQPLPWCEHDPSGILRFESLTVNPGGLGLMHDRKYDRISPNITHCSITVPGTQEYGLLAEMLLCCMQVVQALKICVKSNIDEVRDAFVNHGRSWDLDQLEVHFPSKHSFSSLRDFEMVGLSSHPDSLCGDQMIKFLQRHKDSLQNVELHNIFFSSWELPGRRAAEIKVPMKEVLKCVKTMATLDRFEMSLDYRVSVVTIIATLPRMASIPLNA